MIDDCIVIGMLIRISFVLELHVAAESSSLPQAPVAKELYHENDIECPVHSITLPLIQ